MAQLECLVPAASAHGGGRWEGVLVMAQLVRAPVTCWFGMKRAAAAAGMRPPAMAASQISLLAAASVGALAPSATSYITAAG